MSLTSIFIIFLCYHFFLGEVWFCNAALHVCSLSQETCFKLSAIVSSLMFHPVFGYLYALISPFLVVPFDGRISFLILWATNNPKYFNIVFNKLVMCLMSLIYMIIHYFQTVFFFSDDLSTFINCSSASATFVQYP